MAEVDRDVPVTDLKSQRQQIDETIGSERALMMLLVFFGIFALLLACIGLHGVTSYAVARRTSEIGIRVALGAQRRDVLWMILRQVVVLAVGGLLIGIPVAAAAAKTARAHALRRRARRSLEHRPRRGCIVPRRRDRRLPPGTKGRAPGPIGGVAARGMNSGDSHSKTFHHL